MVMLERIIKTDDDIPVARIEESEDGSVKRTEGLGEFPYILTEKKLKGGRTLFEATDPKTGYTTSHIE
jgi:hypothetical protein